MVELLIIDCIDADGELPMEMESMSIDWSASLCAGCNASWVFVFTFKIEGGWIHVLIIDIDGIWDESDDIDFVSFAFKLEYEWDFSSSHT